MKLKIFVLVGSITTCFPPITAQASGLSATPLYSEMYVVGDSFSDDGNLANYGVLNFPPSEVGYFEGRFSNGPVFVEYLPALLGFDYEPEKNVAVGSSGSGDFHSFLGSGVAGLNQQVLGITSNYNIKPDALIVMVTGINDYALTNTNVDTVVGNISSAIETFSAAGAKNFLVFGLPDLSDTPLANDFDTIYPQLVGDNATQIANLHDDALQDSLDQLSNSLNINSS